MTRDQILNEAIDAVLNCDEDKALEIVKTAIEEGIDPVELLNDGFSVGIRKMGDMFGTGEVFLPELILSAEVMKAASGALQGAIKSNNSNEKAGKMLIATVEGDVHDIGKGIVVSLISTQGIEVIDLGRDVPVQEIVEKAVEHDVDIIGTSALLTTTLVQQQILEEELRKQNLRDRFKTMVGGAPCTQRWADKIGADAFGEDASEAVSKALELLAQ
jgi:trimethylamine corrinoid protein